MERKFILSCGSTVDLPYSYVQSRDIPVIFYSYTIGDKEYVDDMERDPDAMDKFYAQLAAGALPHTSQINEASYMEFFEEQLQKGDLLHLAFGSGMSASVNNAMRAAEQLREKYPNRKIIVVDSLCSSSGYGLLMDYAADMRDAGATIEETEEWLLENRNHVHHQFFSTDLTFFRRSGRVSGAAATLATILGLCPIMRLCDEGRIIAYDKVRGKKKAVAETVRVMLAHAQGGADYDGKCYICHSVCLEEAQALRAAVEETFPKLRGRIRICNIGTIIASHSGPGTVAVFFLGDDRLPE